MQQQKEKLEDSPSDSNRDRRVVQADQQQQQQQNASAILESVSELLEKVGSNFFPIHDIGKIMQLDAWKGKEKDKQGKNSTTGPLRLTPGTHEEKQGTMDGVSMRQLLMQMKSQLHQLQVKLQQGLDQDVERIVDGKVQQDIGRMIDHMRKGGCPLYGVFSLLNAVADRLSGGQGADQDLSDSFTDHLSKTLHSFTDAAAGAMPSAGTDTTAGTGAGTGAGALKKIYGLPPQSIMDAYMPASVVASLTEKKAGGGKDGQATATGSTGKLRQESPNHSSMARDWGRFGQQIQQDYEAINEQHRKQQAQL